MVPAGWYATASVSVHDVAATPDSASPKKLMTDQPGCSRNGNRCGRAAKSDTPKAKLALRHGFTPTPTPSRGQ
jgi:hypothetical protein